MKRFLIFILWFLFTTRSPVQSADTVHVSSNYTAATCTEEDALCPNIRSALDVVSNDGVVFLAEGTYSGLGNEDICVDSCLGLSNITIAGTGSTAADVVIEHSDFTNSTSIAFWIRRDQITTLEKMTIRNFPLSVPVDIVLTSAILGRGAVVVEDCGNFLANDVIFQNNSANSGGAMTIGTSNATFRSCSFLSNVAQESGAAVYSFVSNLQIEDSEFSSNNVSSLSSQTAGIGGALHALGKHTITIKNSYFNNNGAERAGGAIYIDSTLTTSSSDQILTGHLTITDSLFSGNFASGTGNCLSSESCNTRGGAVYSSAALVQISDSVFEENFASTSTTTEAAQGGALYLTSNSFAKIPISQGVRISGTNFTQNTAVGCGGAIFATGQRLDIEYSVFSQNTVTTASTYFDDSPSQGGAVWYSTGGLDVQQSIIQLSSFIGNVAYSGWGGALFGTDSKQGPLSMIYCTFSFNQALSSYTNFGYGGAVMVSSGIPCSLSHCVFINNTVLPYLDLEPLTFSGSGGALFAQSVDILINNCSFSFNYAITGQFDAGSSGGALVLENSYPALIQSSTFVGNGAAGYVGSSSFASPGAGGAIYVKFSAATIHSSEFSSNWVSAGSAEKSSGGAIAVYFAYASVSDSSAGVEIFDSSFSANFAFGQLCSLDGLAGQGGAVAVIGNLYPAVFMQNCTFDSNIAVAGGSSASYSAGGSVAISLSSNLSAVQCTFTENVALNGAGNDVASLAGEVAARNYLQLDDCTFVSASVRSIQRTEKFTSQLEKNLCSVVESFIYDASADNTVQSTGSSHESDGEFMDDGMANTIFSPIVGSSSFKRRSVGAVENILVQCSQTSKSDSFALKRYSKLLDWAERMWNLEANVLAQFRATEFQQICDNNQLRQMFRLLHSQFVLNTHLESSSHQTRKWQRDTKPRFDFDLKYSLALQSEFQHLIELTSSAAMIRSIMADSTVSSTSTEVFDMPSVLNSSVFEALRSFHPGIVITAGEAVLRNPTFRGVYHIFFGNFPAIITFAYEQSISNLLASTTQVASSQSLLYGRIKYDRLILTAISSEVTLLYDEGSGSNSDDARFLSGLLNDSTYSIDQVNLFNSTLHFGNNISLTRDSLLTSSTLSGSPSAIAQRIVPDQTSKYFEHPSFYFERSVFAGIALPSAVSSKVSVADVIRYYVGVNASEQTSLSIDACTVTVNGNLTLDSPVPNQHDVESIFISLGVGVTNVRVHLLNGGLLNIAAGGILKIVADTVIQAATSKTNAIQNEGNISLLGQASSIVGLETLNLDFSRYYQRASLGSLTSKLHVVGNYVQKSQGITMLILNRTRQDIPVLFLSSNEFFAGKLNLSFYIGNNIYPDLYIEKYSGLSSSWNTIVYGEVANSAPRLKIVAPIGLELTSKMTSVSASELARSRSTYLQEEQYTIQQLKVKEIGCSMVNLYYNDVPQDLTSSSSTSYPCYICLQNSSCAICGNSECGDIGSCDHGTKYKNDCCDGGCNGVYGNCHANDDHTKYECRCTTIFYDGSHCDELTAASYAMIFSAVFLFLLLLLIAYFYRRARVQKKVVLDELADGLLNNQNSGENSAYIQSMQQALILNDVFVNYDEIRLETKVGEGSFGEVHKATFRGAQVAVKKMRSMFAELTEREIDEFRKEAYVMSRLRHPNIVLVMGISLVDQDPVQLPKMRSVRAASDDYGSSYRFDGAGNSSRASKPPKSVCIITEFLEQGSLADILYGPTRLPADVWTYELILTCALQAARGMLYLHSHKPLPICHRDLKSSNLVVDDHWVVKVTDFGMSRIVPENVQDREKGLAIDGTHASSSLDVRNNRMETHRPSEDEESGNDEKLHEMRPSSSIVPQSSDANESRVKEGRLSSFSPEMTSNLGTTAWCAPELLTATTRSRYTIKVDVYSFGMVLWELWEKKRPYEELTSRFDIIDAIRDGNRPPISDNCPPSYRSLIQRCWHGDPARRPMFKYIARYLKDELARVKRQKSINQQQTPSILAVMEPSLNPMHSNEQQVDGSRLSTCDSSSNSVQISSFLRRSFQAAATSLSFSGGSGGTSDTRRSEGILGSSELIAPRGASCVELGVTGNSKQSSFADKSDSQRQSQHNNADVDPSGNYSGTSEEKADTEEVTNFPESRSALIAAAALDRSLSYLVDSPSVSIDQREKTYSNNSSSSTVPRSQRQSAGWRDRYVLRFSGWQSRNPDVGLPPSMSAQPPTRASNANIQVESMQKFSSPVTQISNIGTVDSSAEAAVVHTNRRMMESTAVNGNSAIESTSYSFANDNNNDSNHYTSFAD